MRERWREILDRWTERKAEPMSETTTEPTPDLEPADPGEETEIDPTEDPSEPEPETEPEPG